MAPRPFSLQIDPDEERPLYLRVADALVQAIRTGRLHPGAQLPSSRELARNLSLNRNTLLAAFRELQAQGWIAGAERSGTYVAEVFPEKLEAQGPRALEATTFALAEALGPLTEGAPQGVLDLREGVPDLRLLGVDLLGRAYRRALVQRGGPLLLHPDPQGFLPLRRALARLLAEQRGTTFEAEHLLLTRSPITSVDLVARCLLRPGEAVAVEDPGHPKVWELLRRSGFRTIPIPVDGEGLDVQALAGALDVQDIRLVYLTPFAQYPTTVPLTFERRGALLELARRRNLAILEDDTELGLGFTPLPRPSLAAQEHEGRVLYLSSFNRILAPNLPLAFLAAPRELTQQLARLQGRMDAQGDPLLACALTDLMVEGEVERHLHRLRKALRARRDALVQALHTHLGSRLAFEVPQGGMALWVRTDPSLDLRTWHTHCRQHGILFHPGSRWSHAREDVPGLRLGFSGLTPEELVEAAHRLALGIPSQGQPIA